MIGAHTSVSTVSFAVIGYHCNCLDGQLDYQTLTHCIIGGATKLLTVQLVICGMAQNTEGILTLQMFLLSDRSLMQM